MTSKEALKTIKYTNTNHIKYSKIGMPLKLYSVGELRKTEIKTIQKDLEKLKKLEKENQELLINKNVAQKIAIKLKNENTKLKKAVVSKKRIQSLRETANPIYEVVLHIPLNLLKEVLESE